MEETVGVSDSEEWVGFCQVEVWKEDNLGRWYEIDKHGARTIHNTESIQNAEFEVLIM